MEKSDAVEDPVTSATHAGLVYTHLDHPGITRKRAGKNFAFFGVDGKRIRDPAYAKENKSFGLTTIRNRHVAVNGSKIHFEFRGKSGVEHAIDLRDKRLAKVIKRCQELPEQELFEYVNEDGSRHAISSSDVNAYLKEISGEDFTAKDFRTWAGTVAAAIALRAFEAFTSQTQAKEMSWPRLNRSRKNWVTPRLCAANVTFTRRCWRHT